MQEIEEVARRIAEQFQPERIILFGSYAYGAPTPDSDVDLLVILPFEGHPGDKSAEIALRIHPRFPTDILVRRPDVVQQRLALGDVVLQEIMKQGRVLYECDHCGMDSEG